MTFFRTIDRKAATVLLLSDNVYTSTILVQAYQRVNVGIVVGSIVSDMLSEAVLSSPLSGPLSNCSAVITVQRQNREEMGGDFWHDVESWSIVAVDGEESCSENISDKGEPEVCWYRLGIKKDDYESGVAIARLGTA